MTRKEYLELSKEEQKEVREELWAIVKAKTENDDELKEALSILKPALFGVKRTRIAQDPKWLLFANSFEKVGDELDELEVFKQLKAGRSEVTVLIRDVLKKSIETERKWIKLDPEKEVYTLVAIGKKTPKDWTGYIPPEIESDIDDIM